MSKHSIFDVNPRDNIEYIQIDNTYTFFDGAVSFLAGLCSTNLLIDSYMSEAIPYKEGHYLFFEGRSKATNKIYYFFPYEIYKFLIDNKWPESIKLYYKLKEIPDQVEVSDAIIGFDKVFLALGQATFTRSSTCSAGHVEVQINEHL